MSYTIGIGLLIDTPAYNAIRALELQIADTTGNDAGLGQPPHITIKRPFEVASIEDIDKCTAAMMRLGQKSKSLNLHLDGIADFGERVIYLRVVPDESLRRLHDDSLLALEALFPGATSQFEADTMVFHSTLAMDLKPEQFSAATQLLATMSRSALHFTIPVQRMGLFLGINNNKHWVVLSEANLQ